jgi:hypothetical protein
MPSNQSRLVRVPIMCVVRGTPSWGDAHAHAPCFQAGVQLPSSWKAAGPAPRVVRRGLGDDSEDEDEDCDEDGNGTFGAAAGGFGAYTQVREAPGWMLRLSSHTSVSLTVCGLLWPRVDVQLLEDDDDDDEDGSEAEDDDDGAAAAGPSRGRGRGRGGARGRGRGRGRGGRGGGGRGASAAAAQGTLPPELEKCKTMLLRLLDALEVCAACSGGGGRGGGGCKSARGLCATA